MGQAQRHCFISNDPLYGLDIVIPIEHTVDQELICQRNQAQINKADICKNSKRVDRDYKVGDKVMLNNNYVFKYQTPYKGSFEIKQCCTNGNITLQNGATKLIYNLHHIKPYTPDTNVKDAISKKDM